MLNFITIFVGGGLGALTRFTLTNAMGLIFSRLSLPLATIIVNLTGSLAIGIAYVLIEHYAKLSLRTLLNNLLIVGFLGGYTTFSAFSLDSLKLIQQQRITYALGNIFISVTLGLICVWVGVIITKKFI